MAIVDMHKLTKAGKIDKLNAELQLNPLRINEHECVDNKTVLHISAERGNMLMIQML